MSVGFRAANKGSCVLLPPDIVKTHADDKKLRELKLANEIYHKFLQDKDYCNPAKDDKDEKEGINPWIEVATNVSDEMRYIMESIQHLIRTKWYVMHSGS
jgi:hypothetical protein